MNESSTDLMFLAVVFVDSPPARRSRRSRGRRRTIPRATGAEDSDNDDEEEEEVLSEDSDLPSYDIPGTPRYGNPATHPLFAPR